MRELKKNLFNPYFSHIYIEKRAMDHPSINRVLSNFPKAKIIEINHYKDVFSRSHQNYNLQKKSPNLILALKKDKLIYEGATVCQDFGNEHFYYTSNMMNCIYDCEYCYLQGMYTSANVVIFVNIEDIFSETKKLLNKYPIYLCVSYDTDILALENVVGYGRKWIEFAKKHKDVKIELRTKSCNFKAIEDIDPIENVIIAWTLSPNIIIKNYENKTPGLEYRLSAIKKAIDRGWKVRLCFDPILYVENWKERYEELIYDTFNKIPANKVHDVSLGVFRVSKDYLKRMRKQRPDSCIINYPFKTVNGVCSYEKILSQSMITFVYELISRYIEREKIYI